MLEVKHDNLSIKRGYCLLIFNNDGRMSGINISTPHFLILVNDSIYILLYGFNFEINNIYKNYLEQINNYYIY